MATFLVTFVVMLVVVAAMAIGVIVKGREKAIKGSCGGLNAIEGAECGICTKPCEKRLKMMADIQQQMQLDEETR